MATKSLSTSTLSLRFMQNAHRAKQLKEVELDRAEVKDDGKWEVSQVVRDSWGLSKESPQSVDVHEESYLPFLFSGKSGEDREIDGVFTKATGRRIFNKKGEEVSTTAPESEPPVASSSSPSNVAPPASGRKIHPRPISISASGKSGQLRGFEELKPPKDAKTAKQMIFESGGVGVDIRAMARKATASSVPNTFMKPVGKTSKRQREAVVTGSGSSEMSTKAKKKRKKSSDS
ncbi:hypothetical protein M413DRAFT_450040 [Hebeloma cylindrosporum]|uniref:Uncharacterized protein n=1 Tax=Hebeloma cylindrosporum TaxID=76867 RepID=A0A0C3BRX6_HEBCY|nr:hypothetical protein M413DRAFT_450040 [Hebeloma cylindrosporum h7]